MPQGTSAWVAPVALRPAGPGGFRKSFLTSRIDPTPGVAILCYYGLDDLKRGVESVLRNVSRETSILVFDNSENFENGEWMLANHPEIAYIRSPYNVGCSNSRNRIAEHFASLALHRFIIQDQDVEWTGDAYTPMNAVFNQYPDTGIVTWPLALVQMAGHRWDATGVCGETPGMCCMYSLEALAAGDDPNLVGWCPDIFMHREDTAVAFALGTKGYKTRVVLDVPDRVAHNHPHAGIQRYPGANAEWQRSDAILRRLSAQYGWPAF